MDWAINFLNPLVVGFQTARFILAAMPFDPYLTDETSIAPPTPGAALVRLSEAIGAVRRVQSNETAVPETAEKLASARAQLLESLEQNRFVDEAFRASQNALRELFAQTLSSTPDSISQSQRLGELGFCDPHLKEKSRVLPVDVSTVLATHFKPQRQVFTTLCFREAFGATAYWLLEVREFDGQEILEGVVENYAPLFSRVRLPVGAHRLVIESRNPSHTARSEEFVVEVPAL